MYIYIWVVKGTVPLKRATKYRALLLRRCGSATRWRRLLGFPKMQIIFHKRATKYRALLLRMTYKDKGSYESSPPCNIGSCFCGYVYIYVLCGYLNICCFCGYVYICVFCGYLYICVNLVASAVTYTYVSSAVTYTCV